MLFLSFLNKLVAYFTLSFHSVHKSHQSPTVQKLSVSKLLPLAQLQLLLVNSSSVRLIFINGFVVDEFLSFFHGRAFLLHWRVSIGIRYSLIFAEIVSVKLMLGEGISLLYLYWLYFRTIQDRCLSFHLFPILASSGYHFYD